MTVDNQSWQAISRDELQLAVRKGVAKMNPEEFNLWNAVQIDPEKWRQDPWGTEGGGFWVVGIIGQHVLWFNDIEDGFNTSRYSEYGTIDEYRCDQDDLEITVRRLRRFVDTGKLSASFGPPITLETE